MPRGPRGLWSGAPRGLAEVGGPHAPVIFPVAHVLTGRRDAPPPAPSLLWTAPVGALQTAAVGSGRRPPSAVWRAGAASSPLGPSRFAGSMERQQTDNLLKSHASGTYLIRERPAEAERFAISIKYGRPAGRATRPPCPSDPQGHVPSGSRGCWVGGGCGAVAQTRTLLRWVCAAWLARAPRDDPAAGSPQLPGGRAWSFSGHGDQRRS